MKKIFQLALFVALAFVLSSELSGQKAGEPFLQKDKFLDLPGLGKEINQIELGEFDPAPGPEIGLAGEGAFILGRGRALVDLGVGGPGDRLRFTDVDNDGQRELLNAGMTWAASRGALEPFRLFDLTGEGLWSYDAAYWGPQHAPNPNSFMLSASATTGDLDADGATDIVIWGPSPVNLQRVDGSGEMVWRQHEERSRKSHTLRLCDFDGRPGEEIVHSHGKKGIRVRNASGKIIHQLDLPFAGTDWTIVHWEPIGSRPSLLAFAADDESIEVLDSEGQRIRGLQAPDSPESLSMLATPVRLGQDHEQYLAVALRSREGCPLYIFSPTGDLVFEDQQDDCSALAAIPSGPGIERLLLADGKGALWSYRPAQP